VEKVLGVGKHQYTVSLIAKHRRKRGDVVGLCVSLTELGVNEKLLDRYTARAGISP
jgi:hypothetical protein